MAAKKKKQTDRLLEQYISNIVKKELQNEDLTGAFVDPFVDIFKTAMYGIKDVGARLKSSVKVLVQGLPTLFVPFMEIDYKKIKEEEKAELDKLKAKYQDVLDRNDAAFIGTDLQPLSFLLDPSKYLGFKLAQKATPVAGLAVLRTLQVLTGGTIPAVNSIADKWEHTFGMGDQKRDVGPYKSGEHGGDTWGGYGTGFQGGGGWGMGGGYGSVDYGSGGDSGYGDSGGGMFEDINPSNQQQLMVQMNKDIQGLLASKELIGKSPLIQGMAKDLLQVFVGHVSKFMSLKNYDELNSQYGHGVLNKVNASVQQAIKQAKNPEEAKKVKEIAFLDLKNTYKSYYINKIKQLISQYPHLANAGAGAINQIKQMK